MNGTLTRRQRDALIAYARAGSVKGAAHELGITPRTVKRHLAGARERLDVESLVQAVILLADAIGTGTFRPLPPPAPGAHATGQPNPPPASEVPAR